jgi:hypothetical protein
MHELKAAYAAGRVRRISDADRVRPMMSASGGIFVVLRNADAAAVVGSGVA